MKHKALQIIYCVISLGTACCTVHSGFAQQSDPLPLSWKTLGEVSFEYRWDENAQMEVSVPDFQTAVLEVDGVEVAISGYMIPVDVASGYYVISAFPFAACFFCGGAGPESVIDLHLRKETHFKTDERLTICGTLSVNRTDVYQLPYQLLDARPCERSGK